MMKYKHIPVLLNEVIEGLNIREEGIYVDCTLGRGGHSSEILKRLTTGQLYCFDQDEQAIEESYPRLREISSSFALIHANFSEIRAKLSEYGIDRVDGILFDLGVSSAQFDEQDRGFSYRFDARLDMRMNQKSRLSAYEVVNTYSPEDLHRIIRDYGEEKYAYAITREIVRSRKVRPIETTLELVEIIKRALPMKVLNKVGHPAKQTFQAIRIEVNDELNVLKKALKDASELLNPRGRMCVISFNSLEDRIVKQFFNELGKAKPQSRRYPTIEKPLSYTVLTRKVIVASEKEVAENNRAKSAKLRILERNEL